MPNTLLVLGATSDIGIATARRFAEAGYNVILAARDPNAVAANCKDLAIRHNVEATTARFDAEDTASHAEFYRSLAVEPDVVLYAAGVLGGKPDDADTDDIRRIMDVNLTGAASILNIAAAAMERRGSGTIIGISSVAGDRGRASNYLYGAAKAGFTAFLAGLRHRLTGKSVHVVTVKPGFVATKMTDGMDLPKPLTADTKGLANAIFKASERKKRTIYYLPAWRLIMWVIREVPEFIFVKTKL